MITIRNALFAGYDEMKILVSMLALAAVFWNVEAAYAAKPSSTESHMGVSVTEHVVLEGGFSLFRYDPDTNTSEGEPFVVPEGSVLVLTDISCAIPATESSVLILRSTQTQTNFFSERLIHGELSGAGAVVNREFTSGIVFAAGISLTISNSNGCSGTFLGYLVSPP